MNSIENCVWVRKFQYGHAVIHSTENRIFSYITNIYPGGYVRIFGSMGVSHSAMDIYDQLSVLKLHSGVDYV